MTTNLLRLDDGTLVPMSAVGRLKPSYDEDGSLRVYVVISLDGEKLGKAMVDAINAAYPMIPAAPSWMLAYVDGPDSPDFVLLFSSIVGWQMPYAETGPTPVMPYGLLTGQSAIILVPTGEVSSICGEGWRASRQDAEADLRAKWEAARARAA